MIRVYGIRNCDTMKKAFAWLDAHGLAYEFHDYKKAGIDAATLTGWLNRAERSDLINTRGTTWRKLDDSEKVFGSDAEAASLMAAHPSVIKRPVIDTGDGALLVGFDEARYAAAFHKRNQR